MCSDSQADVRRWRRAQIVEESSTGRLRLSYDGLSDYHDEWVSRDSGNIAPPGCVRFSLKTNSFFFFFRFTQPRAEAGELLFLPLEAFFERTTKPQSSGVQAGTVFRDPSTVFTFLQP